MQAPAKLRAGLSRLKRRLLPSSWARLSYSQEGEDLLIEEIFAAQSTGVYVDVGSHHPYRFSNTYRLYRRGWSGVCIDPLPGTVAAFARSRPRDKALELGISEEPSVLTYHMFNDAALNTFDEEMAQAHCARGNYRIVENRKINTVPLRDILSSLDVHAIDLLTVDVEGFDLKVLQSNDWTRWRPRLVVAESLSADLQGLVDDSLCQQMIEYGYAAKYMTGRNVFFIRQDQGR